MAGPLDCLFFLLRIWSELRVFFCDLFSRQLFFPTSALTVMVSKWSLHSVLVPTAALGDTFPYVTDVGWFAAYRWFNSSQFSSPLPLDFRTWFRRFLGHSQIDSGPKRQDPLMRSSANPKCCLGSVLHPEGSFLFFPPLFPSVNLFTACCTCSRLSFRPAHESLYHIYPLFMFSCSQTLPFQ